MTLVYIKPAVLSRDTHLIEKQFAAIQLMQSSLYAFRCKRDLTKASAGRVEDRVCHSRRGRNLGRLASPERRLIRMVE